MNAARWLGLAASPSFAAMALASALSKDPMAVMCSGEVGPHLGAMPIMYALMSLFHAPAWLTQAALWRAAARARLDRDAPACARSVHAE